MAEEEKEKTLGVRWTVGDVNQAGFEALRLSIQGCWKLFGTSARYLVCVNSIPTELAQRRTGLVPAELEWRRVSRDDLPPYLKLGPGMTEGTGWKFCPPLVFKQIPELALDNDCILWRMPAGMQRWLQHHRGCLIAEDVRPHFGCFASRCGRAPRNSGIRGVFPGYPFEETLARLAAEAGLLQSEGDEQGLQIAAVQALEAPELVRVEEVTICSPFPPHFQALGTCGVHFVGLNTRHFDWTCDGKDPVDLTRANWHRMKPAVEGRLQETFSRGHQDLHWNPSSLPPW